MEYTRIARTMTKTYYAYAIRVHPIIIIKTRKCCNHSLVICWIRMAQSRSAVFVDADHSLYWLSRSLNAIGRAVNGRPIETKNKQVQSKRIAWTSPQRRKQYWKGEEGEREREKNRKKSHKTLFTQCTVHIETKFVCIEVWQWVSSVFVRWKSADRKRA